MQGSYVECMLGERVWFRVMMRADESPCVLKEKWGAIRGSCTMG